MFPLVPYHALPRLHELVKDDCPPPYRESSPPGAKSCPPLLRQVKDPGYHVKRTLPTPTQRREAAAGPRRSSPAKPAMPTAGSKSAPPPIWAARTSSASTMARRPTPSIRTADGKLHATDGICTHGNTHLADGLVKGSIIECPKHNGRFNLADGSPARAPICRGLAHLSVGRTRRHGSGSTSPAPAAAARASRSHLSASAWSATATSPPSSRNWCWNRWIRRRGSPSRPATTCSSTSRPTTEIRFRDFDIPEPYRRGVGAPSCLRSRRRRNPAARPPNNYSLASNHGHRTHAALQRPHRHAAAAGRTARPASGSSYMFSLKPGDEVTAIGPFGDFHIKPTQKEMVYIGGGAGMAPLRAHLSHLFETAEDRPQGRAIWYGARSRQETLLSGLLRRPRPPPPEFPFPPRAVRSAAGGRLDGAHRGSSTRSRSTPTSPPPEPRAIEFYLCGPPAMINACTAMLDELGVPPTRSPSTNSNIIGGVRWNGTHASRPILSV